MAGWDNLDLLLKEQVLQNVVDDKHYSTLAALQMSCKSIRQIMGRLWPAEARPSWAYQRRWHAIRQALAAIKQRNFYHTLAVLRVAMPETQQQDIRLVEVYRCTSGNLSLQPSWHGAGNCTPEWLAWAQDFHLQAAAKGFESRGMAIVSEHAARILLCGRDVWPGPPPGGRFRLMHPRSMGWMTGMEHWTWEQCALLVIRVREYLSRYM